MDETIDVYDAELPEDYSKIVEKFGLETFNPKQFPEPNRLMRRGIVFAGRDLEIISKCIKEKKPFYTLTGIMPSADRIHFGNKMSVENLIYFQKHGAKTFILVADLEAASVRGVTLEEARKRSMEFHIPAYIALGLDPKKTIFYFQSENKQVVHLAYEFAKKITLSEFKAIYGNADPSRILSALTQAGDIIYPQLEERMPGIIPTAIDQDPHLRLTRDIVNRSKAKKFFAPSALYTKFTPSLDGAIKMSKSKPESCIELPEDSKIACKKLKRALTGGRENIEEQRKLGGIPEECMIFEMYKQHLIESDEQLKERYELCKTGKVLCGECKEHACQSMTKFMEELTEGIEKAKKQTDKIHFVKFN